MMSVDDLIRNATNESDISFRSSLYAEITRELTDFGLNLAFFVFTTSEHSFFARTLDGNTTTFPVLTLFLKYDFDFNKTGIRDAVNAALQRHGFEATYVSDHTFVFVRTLEKLAFQEIGRECKNALQEFVCGQTPGVEVSHVFWNGQKFHVIMKDKADYKRVKRDVEAKVMSAIPRILATADKYRHCQSYKAAVEFGYLGMNLLHQIREDI